MIIENPAAEAAIAKIFKGDVSGAKEILQPLEGKLRDDTLYEIAAALANVDVNFATEIAENIKDEKLKGRALRLIAELRENISKH